jgi:hypothetical protein
MGYFQNAEEEQYERYYTAVSATWKSESRHVWTVPLGELLERCIKAGVKAVGERWPEEKPAAKVAPMRRVA